MLDWLDVTYRLCAATVVGSIIGLNREFHGKPTGVRTLGLVGLGSASLVLAMEYVAPGADPASRVIQGVITGIGFLGAGIILRRPQDDTVHGMTTAAAIWVTACLGLACGIGAWPVIPVAVVLLLLLLIFGGPVEKALHRHLITAGPDKEEDEDRRESGTPSPKPRKSGRPSAVASRSRPD